jgi:serine/threonine protein kinase
MIGQVLEKYEVLEKVGEGGMATVYKGRHRTLDREVAIKILHPHLSDNDTDDGIKNRTRFEREARAIESLDCLNIPEIYDFSGPEAEHCFIITEFIHGPTLSDFMDRVERIPSEPAALIGIQVCSALICAHTSGIIHRDIKPENIMIDGDGCVKLMDFGIARMLDETHVTLTGALVGSPAFMSPEQALDREVDGRSDLFSLGTLLYLLVTGEMPFRGGNPSVVLKGIIEGQYEDPIDRTPDIHPQLAHVIDRCLSTIPEERPPSAEAVRDELRAVLEASGIHADDPGELWDLPAYFRDAEDYATRLDDHLVPSLIRRGRELIEAREPTEALRILNRVLTLDDGNAEVIDLIGRMGGEPERASSSWWLYAALVLILGAVGTGLWWQLWRTVEPPFEPGAEHGSVLEPFTDTLDGFAGSPLLDEVEPTPDTEPITDEEVTEASDREEEVTEEATPPLEDPTEAPDDATPGEDGGEEGDAEASLEEITPEEMPRPLQASGGLATLDVRTPDAAGMKLYYRYSEGGEAHLLSDEAQIPRQHPVQAGRIQVWVEGEYHRTRSVVIDLATEGTYKDKWYPELKPAVVDFSGLPDGTAVLVDGVREGEFPQTRRISIPARQVVRIVMRAPDGEERPCTAYEVEPNATHACSW